jgi:UDP-glucose 4-epimerase
VNLSNARIFVTGGAGFIGSHLVHHLSAENEVTVYDNAIGHFPDRWTQHSGRINVLEGDISDRDHLRAAVHGHDVVIHAAALAGVGAVSRRPLDTLRVNAIGTVNVLDAAAALRGVHRVVCLSTSEVTGSSAYRIPEASGTIVGPAAESRWAYAAGKAVGEHFALAYQLELGLPTTVVRPFNVYGPGQVGEGAIRNFVQSALVHEDLVIHGDGDEIRSWTYVGDMVDALELACTTEAAIGQVFNIGNPEATHTTLDLARRVIELAESRSHIRHEEPSGPAVAIRVPHIDKAKALLGFHPSVDITTGLLKTIRAYRRGSESEVE